MKQSTTKPLTTRTCFLILKKITYNFERFKALQNRVRSFRSLRYGGDSVTRRLWQ